MNKVQEDAIRNILGKHPWETLRYYGSASRYTGAFYESGSNNHQGISAGNDWNNAELFFDASRTVPTAVENRPINVAYNIVIGTGRLGKKSDEK